MDAEQLCSNGLNPIMPSIPLTVASYLWSHHIERDVEQVVYILHLTSRNECLLLSMGYLGYLVSDMG